ncbi:MAG: metal-dependent hydrolase [Candidatus Thiodiazotropha sp. 6PLUC2]
MFIAHAPAGYLVSRMICRKLSLTANARNRMMASGIFGSIAPDFDLFYFYFIDNQQYDHHIYYTHYPIVWACLMVVSIVSIVVFRKVISTYYLMVFSLCGFIHLLLDSVVGNIYWLAPFSDRAYALHGVVSYYTPWWLNFVLHWTFLFELIIVALALYININDRLPKMALNSAMK